MVEALVVLGTVAVLSGLLGTAALHARASARMTACAANLKDIGQAFTTFVTDSNGYMPLAYYALEKDKDGECVVLREAPKYQPDNLFGVAAESTFKCRDDDTPVGILGKNTRGADVTFPSSYSYNTFLPLANMNISRVARPVNTVTFFDGDATAVVGRDPFNLEWPMQAVRFRHGGQANFLFLDGHVEPRMSLLGGDDGVLSSFSLTGVMLNAKLAVNPNNSGSNGKPDAIELQLVLSDGTVLGHEELLAGIPISGSGFSSTRLEYTGPAVSLKIKPKSPSKSGLKINGHSFALPMNRATVISGSDLEVHLYNDDYTSKGNGKGKGKGNSNNSGPMGHWWIELSAGHGEVITQTVN